MTATRTHALLVAALALTLAACGGSSDSGSDGGDGAGIDEQAARKDRIAISLSPQTASLVAGATQQFSATVSGTEDTGAIFTIEEGAAGGSVSATGLYTAPSAPGTYRVAAASLADPRKVAVATVTVTAALVAPPVVEEPPPSDPVAPPPSDPVPPPPSDPAPPPPAEPAPQPIAVGVSPPSASLPAGGSQQFTASVTGTANASVVWTIQEGAAAGAVSSTGLFTASSAPGTYRLVATSVVDPARYGVAEVTVAAAAATTGIPEERTTRWQPGIPGGVPARTTVCATISAATYGNGSTDARGAIQGAIDACPANQVVYLPAGTYRLSGTLNLTRPVVLRGAGANQTILRASGTGVKIGTWMSFGSPVSLTANAAKGATTVTVSNAAPFSVGDVVHLDQVDDPRVVQGTTCQYFKRGSSGAWRSIGQRVEIVGKNGNTLTLASPLHWTFTTALQAQLVPMTSPTTKYAGVEDLRIEGASGAAVSAQNAAYSWVKGVETSTVDGVHVILAGTYRFVLRDSYSHHSARYSYGGNSYGYSIEHQASDSLIENNIVHYMNKPIQFRASGGGNVIAYNYVDDSWSQPDSNGQFWYQEMSIDVHCAFPHMELVEGNYAPHMGGISTWGNAGNITYFRNQATSVFRTIALTSPSGPGNQAALGFDARMLGMNVVGNVLGAPGLPGAAYETTGPSNCQSRVPFIYRLNSDGSTGYCTFPSPVDTQAASTLLRHGNFDHVSNAVQWAPNVTSRTLPSSLYLAGRPAFFGSSAWPWVDPGGSSRVSTLPAKARFDAGRPNG